PHTVGRLVSSPMLYSLSPSERFPPLPGFQGRTVTRRLREDSTLNHIPVQEGFCSTPARRGRPRSLLDKTPDPREVSGAGPGVIGPRSAPTPDHWTATCLWCRCLGRAFGSLHNHTNANHLPEKAPNLPWGACTPEPSTPWPCPGHGRAGVSTAVLTPARCQISPRRFPRHRPTRRAAGEQCPSQALRPEDAALPRSCPEGPGPNSRPTRSPVLRRWCPACVLRPPPPRPA